ncbi:hypothetical protein H0X91_34510, partial [Burkholderia sp. 9777_1386]|uniref:beta strand repeat-containing protein n=1 Tax=Burkholderia sp. 9777_1386 TaxID=2751183 RepID=UPI001A3015E7|nr:hypothetical protein [Burkholderia sp. 9777_1386]
MSKSLRRRIMAAWRRAHRILGIDRRNLGLGQIGIGGNGSARSTIFSGNRLLSVAMIAGAALLVSSEVKAQSSATWTGKTNNSLIGNTNWNPVGSITGKALHFGTVGPSGSTVSLNDPTGYWTSDSMTFDAGAAKYNISIGSNGQGGLTLSNQTTSIKNNSGQTQIFILGGAGAYGFLAIKGGVDSQVNFNVKGLGYLFGHENADLGNSTVNLTGSGALEVSTISGSLNVGALSGTNMSRSAGGVYFTTKPYTYAGTYDPSVTPNQTIFIGALNANTTYDGPIRQTDGANGSVVKVGTGQLTLGGVSEITGGTSVQCGTLAIANNGSLSAQSALNVAAGATLDLTQAKSQIVVSLSGATGSTVHLGASGTTLTFGDGTSQTFGGAIDGSGGFTKQGTGTQTVTGNIASSVNTTVNAGNLVVANGGNVAGNTTVNNGTFTAGPNGTVSGNTAVNPNGTLALNNGNVTGNTALNNGTVASIGSGNASLGNVTGNG